MSAETTQEAVTEEPRKCRDVKNGRIDLHCTEPEGHDKGPGATWHKAECVNHQVITYDGGRHEMHQVETVTWEPVDHVAEAVRHLTAGRRDR